jgi:hypothetical protein
VQHAEESVPWSDGIAVLVSENAGDLMEMGQIVRGPGGEQLTQGNDAERGMASALFQIGGLQVERAQLFEICGAEAREVVQSFGDRYVLTLAREAFSIEGLEGAGFTEFEDHFCAGHPVGALAVDKVADGIEGAPCLAAFVVACPLFGEIAK